MERLTEIDRAATRRNPRALSSWERARHVSRFLLRVNMTSRDECWEWTGPCFPNKYGQIGGGGYAHRAMYEIVVGRALESHEALMHSCDNPPCCNPTHLKVGTSHQNNEDTHRKGRHPLALLTAEQVREMRLRRSRGEKVYAIAKDYGVSDAAAGKAIAGITYAWVT